MTDSQDAITHCSNSKSNSKSKKRQREDSSSPPNDRKRPTTTTTTNISDAYSRIASNSKKNESGRGSQAGWTYCPLCFPLSRKMFAQGRGIASHLHAVHTPWKEPSKAERKRRRKLAERNQREQRANQQKNGEEKEKLELMTPSSWEPTSNEVDDWNARVLQIVQELDEKPLLPEEKKTVSGNQMKGVDRNGNAFQAYRSSLPPFLQAAADGDLEELKRILHSKSTDEQVLEELNRTDRHLSIAEHWAAGGGHLECLKFLLETRKRIETTSGNDINHTGKPKEKVRRRDGKTALHYAARNGKVDCIDYLIRQHGHTVDEVSGDGSTPLHLACFGGHLEAMEALIDRHGANARQSNDWDCTCAHWIAMTKCESTEQVHKMCQLLQSNGVSFVRRQKQGHTALHKAAQRQNKHVIEWLANDSGAGLSVADKQQLSLPDEGGHTPSDIWLSVGGDPAFGEWMKTEMGW